MNVKGSHSMRLNSLAVHGGSISHLQQAGQAGVKRLTGAVGGCQGSITADEGRHTFENDCQCLSLGLVIRH